MYSTTDQLIIPDMKTQRVAATELNSKCSAHSESPAASRARACEENKVDIDDMRRIVVKSAGNIIFVLTQNSDNTWKLRLPLTRTERNRRQILLDQLRKKRRNATTAFGRLRKKHKNELRAHRLVHLTNKQRNELRARAHR